MKKLLVLLSVLLVISGCTSSEGEDLQKVTVILDYVANTNHTGMYVALEKGYYEAAGLDVEIIEPTEGATATLIAIGKGDFGISYQEDVTVAKSTDEPLPIKAIATIIQNNTSGFATYGPKNINSPADFEGLTYAGWGGPGEEAVLKAVMSAYGSDYSKLEVVLSDGSGFESLEGDVDLKWFYEGWDNVIANMAGFDLNYMELRDLDERLNYYTPIIIANENTLENDPSMVEAFLEATEKGYKDAIENPEEGAQILHEYASDYSLEMLVQSQIYLAGKYMEDTSDWGAMKSEVWDNYTDFLVEYEVIDEIIDSNTLFTNEYLSSENE